MQINYTDKSSHIIIICKSGIILPLISRHHLFLFDNRQKVILGGKKKYAA